ncbi:dipeptide epimerase [Spirosoma utsteinense]|uniref:Dipeptide epimerase n=1 Tax=Spirosoma utsteinense TaxID=2585773 RepID=A0ABR6W902_9BACT|nr:dipeptide epimerase [Spirosoma utsteinense]MBC3787307.1 L-alanine-DL-glutamate epimerase-like enolase superfamily enzyme [Spirosoma utsteinense]MBC3792992.1 L-alanine-DL-glutamate epimerase-like enolase superfamily enzyme [Spirosoma utsteinense]
MQLLFHRVDLRLNHTFTIAHDSRDVQPTLIVELRDGPNSGYGEATATRYYGVTIDGMVAALKQIRPHLETADLTDPEAFWADMQPHLAQHPFALCALDQAVWDLWARRQGQPLHTLWNLDTSHSPITNYTIGLDTPGRMVEKMLEFPWPLYKIKLGRPETDIETVRAMRSQTDALFRVDANCGWTASDTIAKSRVLAGLNVEFIEQPLPAGDWEGAKAVVESSALPIIADESCIVESDVDRCAGYFHGVNIKLTKCGGLTPARRMIARARQLGLRVMVGCMTESSVGISAIAQLLPLLDYADLDGSLLIANDPATGVTFDKGRVVYASENGTGVQLTINLNE